MEFTAAPVGKTLLFFNEAGLLKTNQSFKLPHRRIAGLIPD